MDDADSFLLLFTILIPIGLATIWSAVWLWGPKILQREEDGLMIRSALSNKIVVRSFPDRSALQVEVKEQVVQTSRNAPPKKAWFTILKQPGGKSCDLMRTKDQAEAERVAEEVRGFLDAVAIK